MHNPFWPICTWRTATAIAAATYTACRFQALLHRVARGQVGRLPGGAASPPGARRYHLGAGSELGSMRKRQKGAATMPETLRRELRELGLM